MPKRIQLSRSKGWRLPEGAVKVDRTTAFGNPYCVGEPVSMKVVGRWGWEISPQGRKIVCRDADEAVKRFEHCLQWDEAIHAYVRDKLGGRDLACWCELDEPCHADVLLRIANADPKEIRAQNDAADDRLFKQAAEAVRQKVS